MKQKEKNLMKKCDIEYKYKRKITKEEYQTISLFLLYSILTVILSFGIIGTLIIFFKEEPLFLIIGTGLVFLYTYYKLKKFKRFF